MCTDIDSTPGFNAANNICYHWERAKQRQNKHFSKIGPCVLLIIVNRPKQYSGLPFFFFFLTVIVCHWSRG